MDPKRKSSDVPTDNVDEHIPEAPERPSASTSAVGPATGLGDTALDEAARTESELGPGERALERERKATRARPRP